MPDRFLFEVTCCQGDGAETLCEAFETLDGAKEAALFLSREDPGAFIVRGPGAAGLFWLQAIYQDGSECADGDHA